jgi:hypothetical protein
MFQFWDYGKLNKFQQEMRYYSNELMIMEITQKISAKFRSESRECLIIIVFLFIL